MLMESKFTQRGYCFNIIIMEELVQSSLYPLLEHWDRYVPAGVWTSDRTAPQAGTLAKSYRDSLQYYL